MTDYTNLRKIVTGDIIVKCRFGTEIRRIPVNQVPTYDELCLMMYRVFKKEITTPENIALKYMDNEGDMISLLDDIDITHAISISSLLKVTVYDKSIERGPASAPSAQLQSSLIEICDNLNNLIESFQKTDVKDATTDKKDDNKATRRLTPAELAEFLNDTNTVNNDKGSKASVKELTTFSPKATTIPYYPPPTSQPVLQQQQQQKPLQQQPQHLPQSIPQPILQQQPQQQPHHQQSQHTQQQPLQQQLPQQQSGQQQSGQQPSGQQQLHQPIQQQQAQYMQTPPVSTGIAQQQQQRPVSMQQFPSQGSQSNNQPSPYVPSTPQQYNNPTNYQPSNNNDPRLQRQGYYVPPPPSSMNTPQIPPQQPYNVPPPPSARW